MNRVFLSKTHTHVIFPFIFPSDTSDILLEDDWKRELYMGLQLLLLC
jgi:hypothetical protein